MGKFLGEKGVGKRENGGQSGESQQHQCVPEPIPVFFSVRLLS